ncbi:hypothetical protein FQN54_006986 [Arachnomyces sp. PD_36]|nr:hypothetical protein FQN54_006986 [Arachnomyces sp. PD_36]
MYPLSSQIHLAAKHSQTLISRLTSTPSLLSPTEPTTFRECHAPLSTPLSLASSADAEAVNAQADVV